MDFIRTDNKVFLSLKFITRNLHRFTFGLLCVTVCIVPIFRLDEVTAEQDADNFNNSNANGSTGNDSDVVIKPLVNLMAQ